MKLGNLLLSLMGVFLFLSIAPVFAGDLYSFSSPKNAERFSLLTKELRCVVCQNQNLNESNAPLANDLRQKIYVMVNKGKSDQEIKEYLVKRYGEFILLQPPLNKLTYVLWFFPLAILFIALSVLYRSIKTA